MWNFSYRFPRMRSETRNLGCPGFHLFHSSLQAASKMTRQIHLRRSLRVQLMWVMPVDANLPMCVTTSFTRPRESLFFFSLDTGPLWLDVCSNSSFRHRHWLSNKPLITWFLFFLSPWDKQSLKNDMADIDRSTYDAVSEGDSFSSVNVRWGMSSFKW